MLRSYIASRSSQFSPRQSASLTQLCRHKASQRSPGTQLFRSTRSVAILNLAPKRPHAAFESPLTSPTFPPPSRQKSKSAMAQPTRPSDPVEAAKAIAARLAVAEHFSPNSSYVGIGSGTTIVHVVDAIKAASTNPAIRFIPTGYQSRQVIIHAGLTPVALDALPEGVLLDVAFDGADEVDEALNCIKGGGACLFQEKLVVERARKFVCVADYRKSQPRLLTSWPSIPIEVAPIAAPSVLTALRALGSPNPQIRPSTLAKTGPLKTDQDFYIVDAPFAPLIIGAADTGSVADSAAQSHPSSSINTTTATHNAAADAAAADGTETRTEAKETAAGIRWAVEELATRIKAITGVLEVGLFSGPDGPEALRLFGRGGQKPVAVYFGMKDGSVEVRTREGSRSVGGS